MSKTKKTQEQSSEKLLKTITPKIRELFEAKKNFYFAQTFKLSKDAKPDYRGVREFISQAYTQVVEDGKQVLQAPRFFVAGGSPLGNVIAYGTTVVLGSIGSDVKAWLAVTEKPIKAKLGAQGNPITKLFTKEAVLPTVQSTVAQLLYQLAAESGKSGLKTKDILALAASGLTEQTAQYIESKTGNVRLYEIGVRTGVDKVLEPESNRELRKLSGMTHTDRRDPTRYWHTQRSIMLDLAPEGAVSWVPKGPRLPANITETRKVADIALIEQLADTIGGNIVEKVLEQYYSRLDTYKEQLNQHCSGNQETFLAFYDALCELGVEAAYPAKPFFEIAKRIGWWIPTSQTVFMGDFSVDRGADETGFLHVNQGSHCAISYPDGSGISMWKGRPIPMVYLANPELVTVDMIKAISNVEDRRSAIEAIGESRWLEICNPTLIDMDAEGAKTGAATRALMRDALDEQWLVGTDGSTKRTYWMRVANEVKTCKEAHESLCAFDERRILHKS